MYTHIYSLCFDWRCCGGKLSVERDALLVVPFMLQAGRYLALFGAPRTVLRQDKISVARPCPLVLSWQPSTQLSQTMWKIAHNFIFRHTCVVLLIIIMFFYIIPS